MEGFYLMVREKVSKDNFKVIDDSLTSKKIRIVHADSFLINLPEDEQKEVGIIKTGRIASFLLACESTIEMSEFLLRIGARYRGECEDGLPLYTI